MTVEVVNENSLLEFWMRNWLRGERVEGGENLQLDMTPHYQAILVGMYNDRSEEHTSELQSLMRISYAVFCLKKKTTANNHPIIISPKNSCTERNHSSNNTCIYTIR